MRQVGLRELKNHLSRYVRQVRAGHDIQVTDRGGVVAKLLPPRGRTGAEAQRGLAEMGRRGLVSLPVRHDTRLYAPTAGAAKSNPRHQVQYPGRDRALI